VPLSQSASPSVVFVCSSPERLNLGFLTEGKQAAIFITPSSWDSQLAGYLLHQIGSINTAEKNLCGGRDQG
jgi:hypothetical protein